MLPNEDQPTLLGYEERHQQTLPAPLSAPAAQPADATRSRQVQAIINKVNQASAMLAQASDDYERLYVRNYAQAAMDVADRMELDNIVRLASVMVQRAERAIAKANPPNPRGGSPHRAKSQDDDEALRQHTVKQMRQAHKDISDEDFEARVKRTLNDPKAPPLTR